MVRCFNHAIAVTFKIGCLNRISNTARQILVTVDEFKAIDQDEQLPEFFLFMAGDFI